MENETMSTDTDTVETQQSVDTAQSVDDTATDSDTTQSAQTIENTQQTHVPFSKGKEKFVVNGKEVEWDFETAKRYAQKGYSGMEAFQKAAEVERKNKELYRQLYSLAQSNPDELVRIFNPKYQPHASAQVDNTKEVDPFEQRLDMELQRRLAPLQQKLEQYEIDQERKLIQTEIESATKIFPILNDEFNVKLLKAEYKSALQQGLDVTIEDVAFYLSQKLQEREAERMNQTKTRIEQKRKDAPVHVTQTTQSSKKKDMSIDDVKRIAGLIS